VLTYLLVILPLGCLRCAACVAFWPSVKTTSAARRRPAQSVRNTGAAFGKPPVVADLTWLGDPGSGSPATHPLHRGDSTADLAGPGTRVCAGRMYGRRPRVILTKGRHVVRSLRARLTAQRAQENPHRLLKVDLHFEIEGAVPVDAVQRAISLSREKYCSVWHSLNPDIVLQVTSDIRLPAQG
jgi:hypothetical protein